MSAQLFYEVSLNSTLLAIQASNLLRALRQNREASGLGLIEGLTAADAAASLDQGTGGNKAFALPKKISSLARFLMDHLVKESSSTRGGTGKSTAANTGISRFVWGECCCSRYQLVYNSKSEA